MKVSDYIVDMLQQSGIRDAFGYPGAVVCHLMDSIQKSEKIKLHLNYHEQAAAFAACGVAQATGSIGFAYANGGPGFTNLVTGIANAYYDSLPTIFICGQVDVLDSVGNLPIRQRGIQEIPAITDIAKNISKYATKIDKIEDIRYKLERAIYEARNGRPGPCVLEIPANIQRADVEIRELKKFIPKSKEVKGKYENYIEKIIHNINNAKRPCFLIGNGVRNLKNKKMFNEFLMALQIPCVFSLPAMDLLPTDHALNFGFCGMNGNRAANFILGKSDLIISLGSRLDLKQVGVERYKFAPQAKLIRIDIDQDELIYKVREDELQICCDINNILIGLNKKLSSISTSNRQDWLNICVKLKNELYGIDFTACHGYIKSISEKASSACCITADVGQHEIYVAQAFKIRYGQRLFLSLGLASMGFSLPAAIGAAIATGKIVLAFCGDGGIQMNIQELEVLSRDKLPIKVIIFNNYALGMIREFQERNFESRYTQSVELNGYTVPDFKKIALAYELPYTSVACLSDLDKIDFNGRYPEIIEVKIKNNTYLYPRLVRGKPIQYMVPELDEKTYKKYIEL